MRKTILAITLFIFFGTYSSSLSAEVFCRPAILESKKVQFLQDTTCGFCNNSWTPGVVKNEKFESLSYSRYVLQKKIRRLKNSTRGRSKRKVQRLKKKIRTLRQRSNLQQITCLALTHPDASPDLNHDPEGEVDSGTIKFNFSDAVGIAQKAANDSSSFITHTLEVVTTNGELKPALESGDLELIRSYFIAPNDKLYILFYSKVNLETGEADHDNGCLLAEVNKATGLPSCIDSAIDSILWNYGFLAGFYSSSFANPPIQFDMYGAIYYVAQIYGDSTTTVLRMHLDGETYDLINENITINNFSVIDDGTVFLSGVNGYNGARWLRRLSNECSLDNVLANTARTTTFLYQFPDGKLYFGMQDYYEGMYGVYSIDPAAADIDEMALIHNTCWSERPTVVDCSQWDSPFGEAYCGYNPYIMLTTDNNKVFGIVGEPSRGRLIKYYPEVTRPNISIDKIGLAVSVGDNLVLSGIDEDQDNRLFHFTPTTEEEVDLMPDTEIEIYRMHYVESQGKIMFDGLRFENNTYVIGWYDFSKEQLTVKSIGGIKLVDFQTFN